MPFRYFLLGIYRQDQNVIMKGYLILSFCIIFTTTDAFLHTLLETHPSPLQKSHPVALLMEGARNFSLQLLNQLAHPQSPLDGTDKNLVFSPLGVTSVLGLLRMAAEGITRKELNRLPMFRNRKDTNVNLAFRTLYHFLATSSLEKSSLRPAELINSNMFFLDYRMHIYEKYYIKASEDYSADFQTVDFRERLEDSRRAINHYVGRKTRGHILNLLAVEDVTESTEVIIANSVFFQSRWLHEFENTRTKEENFTLNDESIVQVPMMNQREFLRYRTLCRAPSNDIYCGSNDGPEMIELPFRGRRRKLYILVPNERISLREIEDRFSSEIDYWKSGLIFGSVNVKLPKFQIKFGTNLKRSLQRLGLQSLFRGANLERFAPNRGLVSTFTHKSTISVEEGGVSAGSGTGVVTYLRLAFPAAHVHANRPFIFFVEDVITRAIPFLGKVMDPRNTM